MGDGVAIGVDIGGTKVAFVVLDQSGAVLAERRLQNDAFADADMLLPAVASEAKELAATATAPVTGVGVGICELVGLDGEIGSSTTFTWSRADLEDALSSIGPLTVDADVCAAARAEAAFGAGRPYPTFGYVTVGTGISSTFVRDGAPWEGAHGAAQLLGSSNVTLPCPHCGRTADLSLEDVSSGRGILQRYRAHGSVDVRGADDVLRAADAGDETAVTIVADATQTLGSFLALFVNLTDPHALVIGGGVWAGHEGFRTRATDVARSRIWATAARDTPILQGGLGGAAGAIGAAWSASAGARTG